MTKLIFILIFAAVVCVGTPVLAQKKATAQDPQDKPRKVRQEPDNAFKKWLEDVGPIITSQEVKAWNQLDNNAERERFIEDFWDRRKPDRDSTENEYREAYYERIAYVNEHFSSGIPGYKTDRGRVYLKYGKPDDVESHPAGGAYERELSEGGGSTSTYPFERCAVWIAC